ncbi:60S acidic ribosomal protein P2 [Tieghemiomyces parasiticus]|uniref:60S acidic ribosomal protein P2 n=1 Tax=Tieghemiomyces parasiticus TaxID=78921 RepID=A0A9W8ABI3_9FUNG|nr:60S acidic ribosomal protein P2 [Tieghemiomyces parasiticus]
MRYIAAFLLLKLGGTAQPSQADITTLLSTVGVDVDSERLEQLVKELDGKDVNQLIEEGKSKLASVPSGGAVAAGSGGAAAAAGGDAAEAAEEKKDEEEDESDDDMGFGLFD